LLLPKADLLAASGANREPTAPYLVAVRAAPNRDGLSPEMRRELERAEQQCPVLTVNLQCEVRWRPAASNRDLRMDCRHA